MNEELKEVETLITEGNIRSAFRMLATKIRGKPQLCEDALYLVDKVFKIPNLNSNSLGAIHLSLGNIAVESPNLGEKVLERFKKGFSLIQKPEDIDIDYDCVEPLARNRPDLYEGLLDLQHQVEAHYKKLGGKGDTGKNVYRMVVELTKSLPDIGKRYLEDVDQKLNFQEVDNVDLMNALCEMSKIIDADSKLAPLTLPLIEKVLDNDENNSDSLTGVCDLLEKIYKKNPDTKDYVLRLLSKAIKSEKNDEDSLEIGKEIYADIQKEQLTSTITNKLQELKSKTKSEKIEDIPHAKTQVLRELAKDNVSSEKGVVNPKRSDADKAAIKAAVNKAISKTRK